MPQNMTKDEQDWIDAILELGCICCILQGLGDTPPQVHHILGFGKRRLGHAFSIPLCQSHHSSGIKTHLFVSRHPWKAEFTKRYGTDEELLEKVKSLI
mgnify:CR=1 FL=1